MTTAKTEVMNDNVQTYPPDLSYRKLKEKSDSYSTLYRIWVDVIYLSMFCRNWLGFAIISPFITVYVIIFTKYWYLAILYLLWIYYDRETPHTGGRKIKNYNKSIFSKFMRDYFPTGLVKTADLPANKNYILAVFPHGVLCYNAAINFSDDPNEFEEFYPNLDLRQVTLNSNFYHPIFRDIIMAKGAVAASKNSLITILTQKPNSGTACLLVVGGSAEAFKLDANEYQLVLKNRKGFVKVALETGSSLVPVFGFGENQTNCLFKSDWLTKIQFYIYKLIGIAPIIPVGRKIGSIVTIFPKAVPLITVVGKPIDVPKIDSPTSEQINYYHECFMNDLRELFEKYRDIYDPLGNNAKLIYL